jgi:hypothetical protein
LFEMRSVGRKTTLAQSPCEHGQGDQDQSRVSSVGQADLVDEGAKLLEDSLALHVTVMTCPQSSSHSRRLSGLPIRL